MKLYVAGWNVTADLRAHAVASLRSMTDLFPSLDPVPWRTLWDGPTLVAVLSSPGESHQQDLAASDGAVALVDGVAFDADDRLLSASELLAARRATNIHDLDGHFVVVEATPTSLAVTTDGLGSGQVYWCRFRDAHFFSNSVEVLARLTGATELDHEAVAQHLSLDRLLEGVTLLREIRRVPAAERWAFRPGWRHPTTTAYVVRWPAGRGERQPPSIRRLARRLGARLRSVAGGAEPLVSGLTGGLDSRLLAALLVANDLDATYFTIGEPDASDASDVVVAAEIASSLGLSHRVLLQPPDAVVAAWDAASARLVGQNDGMVSLGRATDAIGTQDALLSDSVLLYGIQGEMARGARSTPRSLLRRTRRGAVQQLASLVDPAGGLVRTEWVAATRERLVELADDVFADRFGPADLLDVAHAIRLACADGGLLVRRVGWDNRVFVPYHSRLFLEAALSLSAIDRYSEIVHRRLLTLLEPRLLDWPPDRGYWRVPVPYVNFGHDWWRRRTRAADRRGNSSVQVQRAWLEALRPTLVERALDRPSSTVWEIADRAVFERIMTADDPTERHRNAVPLFDLFTVLAYDEQRALAPALSLGARRVPGAR